ncbi:hypothetical protein [Nitrincola sp. A-D6]|uniref:hypothetical protein n=1 Tax=Nitrincola sp. A-D6 TaxID=1545442 RepID=UPI0011846EAB|nr:hypothetical protein [Nitrincola sp. A-D6]
MAKISEFDQNGNEHLIDGLILCKSYPQLVDKNILQPGDVLFCCQSPPNEIKGKVKTKAIQKFTKGIYVHCGLYIGNDLVADSAGGAVRHIDIDEFIGSYTYIVISRCQYLNEDRIAEMVSYTYECKDKSIKYDLSGALALPKLRKEHRKYIHGGDKKPNYDKASEERVFCSEFVLNCFKASGYIPWDHEFYVSHAFSPTDLAHDELLRFEGYLSKGGISSIHPDDSFRK